MLTISKLVPNRFRSVSNALSTNASRQFKYFDNLEVINGVAIIRFNGPEKMNTISASQKEESGNFGILLIMM